MMMNELSENDLFLILTKDARCPLLSGTEVLEDFNGRCMMAAEPARGEYGLTSPLSNRRLVIEIDALDNSMINKHIVKGDVLKVRTHVNVRDGDVVLAVVNGKSTVRALYCDDDDNTWLVPQNPDYEPVLMTDENQGEIVGKVVDLNRNDLSVSYKELSEPVRKSKLKMVKPKVITDEKISWVIRTIGPSITIARMWFAVFRPMTQVGAFPPKAYDSFANRVRMELPNHEKLPDASELQRFDTLSFAKEVSKWDPDNALVSGSRFYKYKDIGERTLALLLADFENSRETPGNSTENE